MPFDLIDLSPARLAGEYPQLHAYGAVLMAQHGLRSVALRRGSLTWWATRDSMAGKGAGVSVANRDELDTHLRWVSGEVS